MVWYLLVLEVSVNVVRSVPELGQAEGRAV
jgi:hypothetical protein